MDTNVRDLADPTLWERSLERARHRRRIAELSRRSARRRKATSVAVAGAVATSPATPLLSAAGAQGDGSPAGAPPPSSPRAGAELLSRGDVGDAVAQVQRRLGVDDDGIFGPITERAVRRFQATHGLAVTGVVDAATWAAIFRSQVLFLRSAAARADAADLARVAPAIVTRSAADGSPDRSALATADRRASATADRLGPATADRSTPARGDASEGASRRLARNPRTDAAPPPRPAAPAPALSGDCSTVTPVRGVRTGDFGEDRGTHRHAGIDIAAAAGTAVRAAACGRIVEAGVQSGYGNLVCIEHAGGTTTCYAHLSRIDVRMRQWVESGQVIGAVGCTGRCTGPHLHFEVRENGRPVEPSAYVNGTRSLPRGDGGTGGSHPTQARMSSRATTSTWSSGTEGSGGSGWSQSPSEPAPAEQPAPAATAPPAQQPTPAPTEPPAQQPAPAPAATPAEQPAPAPAATPAEQPAPTAAAAPTEPAAPPASAQPAAAAAASAPETEGTTPQPPAADQPAAASAPPATSSEPSEPAAPPAEVAASAPPPAPAAPPAAPGGEEADAAHPAAEPAAGEPAAAAATR